ncbi:hypothetical protein [Halorarius litoreus]|uniref:hypothetical protein n=1 Tax=Halorarius litoreus TaxID=2962676 RepID=UPI0020CC2EB2|nr:hypothetical protein [Halorarius litoreus]
MRRSLLRWYGLFLLLVSQLLVFAFGVDSVFASTAGVTYALLVVAGTLFVVAGSRREVSLLGRTLPWNVLAALGIVCIAATVLASGFIDLLAGDRSRAALAYALVASLGALTLVVIGIDVARGGRHFRLPDD